MSKYSLVRGVCRGSSPEAAAVSAGTCVSEKECKSESAQGGEIQLCLELPPDFKIVVKGENKSEYNVCFLPPLVLNFELPAEYPSTLSPIFTLSSKWITRAQMSSLCRRLDELWEENQGCVILFTWIQLLKEEAVDFLGIQSPLEVTRGGSKAGGERRKTDPAATALTQPGSLSENAEGKKREVKKGKSEMQLAASSQLDPRTVLLRDPHSDLLPQLLDFDEAQRQKVFESKGFCCGICFLEKLGSMCLCFKECQHVYCKACMTEYFQIQIRDGNVQCLNCPETKCTSLATPSQVKQLVDEELFRPL
ncbi:unnamed protein product [Pleuronectes platessa]|uniref:Uncharacterized protein n=1 Tax=Pleuronectes platessa TaxID=8262 RepID=A0A9N7VQU9_PLEPL|nr:unnamed protein product [Pleuronectes platessa]